MEYAASPTGARPLGSVVAGLILLCLCWGTSFPAMSVMVQTLPPMLAMGAVFMTASMLLAASRPKALGTAAHRDLRPVLGAGVCLMAAQGAVATTLQHVPASTAAVLVATVPLWIITLRIALGDHPGARSSACVVIGFVGVGLVLLTGDGAGAAPWPWTLVVVGAALVWAVGTLWTTRTDPILDPTAVASLQLGLGGIILLGAGLVRGDLDAVTISTVNLTSWAAFGHLVLIDAMVGFAVFNWLLRSGPIAVVSTYAYLVPVVAFVIGVAVLREPFGVADIAGATLILAAVAIEVGKAPSPEY